MLTPFVDDPDFTLYVGDVCEVLRGMDAGSVHCCVTSPPYWGLRDYGTGAWRGGEPQWHVCVVCAGDNSAGSRCECDGEGGYFAPCLHLNAMVPARGGRGGSGAPGKQTAGAFPSTVPTKECPDCGAVYDDSQLGLEATPDEYVARMVEVFREVRRVLRPDGTCWLNLGDSYYAAGWESRRRNEVGAGSFAPDDRRSHTGIVDGLKVKDLVGIPWRVAFALQADGWYLRSDIIWAKPNPMPESVTDRPTKAHEYVFLLTKSARYFYDAAAIAEPATWYGPNGRPKAGPHAGQMHSRAKKKPPTWEERKAAGSTRGNVAFDGNVGAGTQRAVHGEGVSHDLGDGLTRNARSVWEIQTQQFADAHFAVFPEALPERCIKAGCPIDGTVLDPFMGSGTTALVARRLGRKSVGVELNEEYAAMAARRLQQLSLLA